jgi:hypothetical protein
LLERCDKWERDGFEINTVGEKETTYGIWLEYFRIQYPLIDLDINWRIGPEVFHKWSVNRMNCLGIGFKDEML